MSTQTPIAIAANAAKEMKLESVLSKFALPEPVPPEFMIVNQGFHGSLKEHDHFRCERLKIE